MMPPIASPLLEVARRLVECRHPDDQRMTAFDTSDTRRAARGKPLADFCRACGAVRSRKDGGAAAPWHVPTLVEELARKVRAA